MFHNLKFLENINDFPKVGLLSMENSGENLLRLYLERIFNVRTSLNIKKEFYNTSNQVFKDNNDVLENSWVITSDFPHRNKVEYNQVNISSAILLVRNPLDLIMSKILKESFFLEEALSKIDQMIEDWKDFYKYWINAPIPIYIIRYEDLINEPKEILKHLSKFLLGVKSIENTKLEYLIQAACQDDIDKHFYTFDVEISESNQKILTGENIKIIQNKFYLNLNKVLKKYNYDTDEKGNSSTWMNEFNIDNLVKSVEFHEFLNTQFLTSSYFSIKLG